MATTGMMRTSSKYDTYGGSLAHEMRCAGFHPVECEALENLALRDQGYAKEIALRALQGDKMLLDKLARDYHRYGRDPKYGISPAISMDRAREQRKSIMSPDFYMDKQIGKKKRLESKVEKVFANMREQLQHDTDNWLKGAIA